MRLCRYILTREDAKRLLAVLTRHGGERTLRDLQRRHRFWPHVVEAAAAAGVIRIEMRRPITGRPSRVAMQISGLVNNCGSAKLSGFGSESMESQVEAVVRSLPTRDQRPLGLTIQEELFVMYYWFRRGMPGGVFGPRGEGSAAHAYRRIYGQSRRLKWSSVKSAGARLARRPWIRAAWFLDRRLQGTGGRLHWPDDMRSACHTWIQLIVEMDAAFDRSWPYDVAHAIRHAHTVWEAKDSLAKLDRFAGREKCVLTTGS